MQIADSKLIYLGFHKCGTTSFWKFFSALGFRVIHNTPKVCDRIGLSRFLTKEERICDNIDTAALDRFVADYDVLTDNPFPLLYEYFDSYYENSSFVLGTRPTEEWLASMQGYFGSRMPALGHSIYATDGNPCSDPESFCRTYDAHNEAVRDYFQGRADFLEIRLGIDSNETIANRLVEFIGLPKQSSIKFERHQPE